MTENHYLAKLDDHTLIEISGVDSADFLQGLITTDIETLNEGTMLPGALLSPQGKILFDFLAGKQNSLYYIDIRSALADAFIKRLSMYKLRSKIEIHKKNHTVIDIFLNLAAQSSELSSKSSDSLLIFNDKRMDEENPLLRFYTIQENCKPVDTTKEKWDRLRIAYGIAESGMDFEPGDTFPHDINFDYLSGISFKKGCYIGQEVVSRMQHRGTVRRRLLVAEGKNALPQAGTVIEIEGRPIGTIGTVIDNTALALARIDRVKAAMDLDIPILADGVELSLAIPPTARFTWPVTIEDSQ